MAKKLHVGNLSYDTTDTPPSPFRQERAMNPKKALQQREKELQSLLATPAGRTELHELESRYHETSERLRPSKSSVVTYILVHERARGLISS